MFCYSSFQKYPNFVNMTHACNFFHVYSQKLLSFPFAFLFSKFPSHTRYISENNARKMFSAKHDFSNAHTNDEVTFFQFTDHNEPMKVNGEGRSLFYCFFLLIVPFTFPLLLAFFFQEIKLKCETGTFYRV